MATTIRTHLWRRVFLAIAAAVLYAAFALALAAALPARAWPPIGGDGYSAAQATVVPAANLFGVAAIAIAVFEPLVAVALRHAVAAAAALAAAAAGPVLALVEGTDADLMRPGTAALAALGLLLGALGVEVRRRRSHP